MMANGLLADSGESTAVISNCSRFRYLLRRVWDYTKIRALIIMLNPSTADARINDATIKACIRLCKALGYGGFEVVNLYAIRKTDPAELAAVDDPVGPENDAIIEAAINRCDLVICAWGAHRMAEKRSHHVRSLLRRYRRNVFCWGMTKSGDPKHPLYIKSGTPLQVFQ
jgi:hypothetical protein